LETKKPQNSLLIVATLGVYLGLVLAGATPQVLANAALTKQFNVLDEIERQDDQDRDPDERSLVRDSLKIYLEDVEYFIESLGRLQKRGSFDVSKDTFDVVQTTLLPCIDANLAGRYTPVKFVSSSEQARPALTYLTRGMTYGYSLGDCVANDEFKGQTAVDNRFDFHFDGKTFWSNIAIKKDTPQRAAELIRSLNATMEMYANASPSELRSTIIRSTVFTSTNDQVMIVTRLPRGSLLPLLNAK
jgi:hypothetical protein